MMEIIKGSQLYKLSLKIVEAYKQGAINNAICSIKTHYTTSKYKVIWEKFVSKESAYKSSCYNRILKRLSHDLMRFGDVYKNSVSSKIFDFFVKLFMRITQGSMFFAPFRKLGVKGFLLLMFGLYLPIDYTLRSVLKIGFLSSVWDELLLVLFVATVLYRKATRKSRASTRSTPLDSYLFMFITVGLFLMCYVSPNFSIALAGYRAVVQYILWFFVIVRLIEDDKDFKILYNTLVGVIIAVGLHGIYQFIIGVEIPTHWVTQSEMGVRTRVFSITGSPNIMGAILVLLTPMITAYAYMTKNFKVKAIAWTLTILMCFSLLFTFSKGAWMGMVVAIVLFAILLDRRIIALLLAGGAGVVILVPSVVNRITYLFTDDYVQASMVGGRMLRWEVGLDLLKEGTPFFGFGLGRFGGAVAMQNQVIEITDTFEYFYMDNYYLKTLVEMGYLGLGFYILLLVAMVFISIKAVGRVKDTPLHAPCVAMLAGMCGVLTHLYFENIFEVPYMTSYFWAMSAMIMYAGFIRKKR